MIPRMEQGPPSTLFGKVFALVFLAGFSIIAFSMGGGTRHFVNGTNIPMDTGGDWIFSAVPKFIGILGAMMFIGVLISPLKKSPRPTASPEFDPLVNRYGDLDERPRPPVAQPQDPPAAAQQALACPGCGTRKNAPGTSNCEYCGSAIKTGR